MAQLTQSKTNRLSIITPPVGKLGFAFDENGLPVKIDEMGVVSEIGGTATDPIKRFKANISGRVGMIPLVSIIENTLGYIPSFNYYSPGIFGISGTFFLGKTIVSIGNPIDMLMNGHFISYAFSHDSRIDFYVQGLIDEWRNVSLIIEVYP